MGGVANHACSTVLSFKSQPAGGEGLFVQGNHFTVEDIALEDGRAT